MRPLHLSAPVTMAGLAVAAVLTALCLAVPARANDSSVEGIGGAVKPLGAHPSIRMVSEDVRIKLPERLVTTRFVFRNEGPATSVLIGFPEQGENAGLQDRVIPRKSNFLSFASWVDGRPITVSRRIEHEAEGSYRAWWVKRVHFGRNQTRVVVNRYRGGEGSNASGVAWCTYILRTGASWKGTIGSARVTADLSGLREHRPWSFSLAGYRLAGDRVTWNFRNFEPSQDVNIEWFQGYANIRVNGSPVAPTLEHLYRDQDAYGYYPLPERRGGTVVATSRMIAHWLGPKTSIMQGGKGIRLTRGDRWVEATVGSPSLRTANGHVDMLWPASSQTGAVTVSLRAVVKALGGSTDYAPGTHTILVNIPPVRSAKAEH